MAAITDLLARDHDRLDALFTKARGDGTAVDLEAYEGFRRGLLRHVGMEELILIPAAGRLRGAAVELARRTRLDHAALTSLLIPNPTPKILAVLHAVLAPHNLMEEREGGLYEQCERALGDEKAAVLGKLRAARDIPPAAHAEGPRVDASIAAALAAAGHAGLSFR